MVSLQWSLDNKNRIRNTIKTEKKKKGQKKRWSPKLNKKRKIDKIKIL